jgi:hypothetical protein
MMMKKIAQYFLTLMAILITVAGCSKQESAAVIPRVVELTLAVNIIGVDTLEVVSDGGVAASGSQGIYAIILVPVRGKAGEVQIRKKGAKDILKTITVQPLPFKQSVTLYYDGSEIHEQAVSLTIKGYATSATLEFLANGYVIGSGTGPVSLTKQIGIEEGKTQTIQIRIKGATDILATKVLASSPAAQSMQFYYDGTALVNDLIFPSPANPASMRVSAKFQTTLPDVYTGPADLLFFSYATNSGTSGAVVTVPEIRIPLPENGAFSTSFELPALPTGYSYAFKVVKRSTADMPYNAVNELMPVRAYAPVVVNFVSGGSQMWIIADRKQVRNVTAPTVKGTTFISSYTDLSQYF